jgi:secondary thiamine-phosphate synthase enzyme
VHGISLSAAHKYRAFSCGLRKICFREELMLAAIEVETHRDEELVEITQFVRKTVTETKTGNGICIVYVPHTTCGLIINENADPMVCKDIITGLNQLLPHDSLGEFRHTEGNSPAHIKSSMMGQSKTFLIENGSIVLGTWQGIFLAEFDGPRKRKVLVKIIKE